jgi:hypothetical protein
LPAGNKLCDWRVIIVRNTEKHFCIAVSLLSGPGGSGAGVHARRASAFGNRPVRYAASAPAGPFCAGELSPGHDTLYALKCNGHVEVWQRQPLE